ncbi:hypothetical protein [Bradyrhizobium iriomotense]|uniref:hypothetical protein n=1 Tax=Bradyrhizobium iriomotense TaxID=441950 RepID=UPI0024E09EDD|nr:hypothetical protein [Bradyrhizobium iriomotense]
MKSFGLKFVTISLVFAVSGPLGTPAVVRVAAALSKHDKRSLSSFTVAQPTNCVTTPTASTASAAGVERDMIAAPQRYQGDFRFKNACRYFIEVSFLYNSVGGIDGL